MNEAGGRGGRSEGTYKKDRTFVLLFIYFYISVRTDHSAVKNLQDAADILSVSKQGVRTDEDIRTTEC